jgi:3-hydroxyacyl-CoA dehydrogenase
VGAGFMGAGIAETAAVAGLEVVLRDVDAAGLDRARTRIETSLKRGVDGGKLDVAHAEIASLKLEVFAQIATAEDIDTGMRLGAGHPMGPLALSDMIGLDTLALVADSMYEEFHREEYSAPPLLKRMVAAGRLGRKSGRGFYPYPR